MVCFTTSGVTFPKPPQLPCCNSQEENAMCYMLSLIINFSPLIYSISVTADYYFNVHDLSNEELLQDNLSMIHRVQKLFLLLYY